MIRICNLKKFEIRTNEVSQRFMRVTWTVDTSDVIMVQFLLFSMTMTGSILVLMSCVFPINHIIHFICYVLYIYFHLIYHFLLTGLFFTVLWYIIFYAYLIIYSFLCETQI